MPSILGSVAPRATWLIANRLGLSELGRVNKDIPDENKLLAEWAEQPTAERLARVVRHMKEYYYPKLSEDDDTRDPVARRQPARDGGRGAPGLIASTSPDGCSRA